MQSRTQSPQDLWPAVGHQSSPGDQPLAKDPKDYGCEIESDTVSPVYLHITRTKVFWDVGLRKVLLGTSCLARKPSLLTEKGIDYCASGQLLLTAI